MTTLEWINETEISDGKSGKVKVKVKPGDIVDLIPVDLLKIKEGHPAKYFAQERFDYYRGLLGGGPYTITRIGKTLYDKVFLYLKTATGEEVGVSAKGFMIAN